MIRFFDMFSGIGGFRTGLERAGGYECIGHCEIDKYADTAYRSIHNIKESEVFYEDATTIDTKTLPEFELLCAGFPCQSFSIAGKRRGFSDPRGNLFFEVAGVARAKRPAYLLLENVPGLLSHDKGRTFVAILNTLCDLGYSVEWQVLNSKDFGVPQSRRRVYIIGYLNRGCAGKILPVKETNAAALIPLVSGRQDDSQGPAKTLSATSGGFGGKTGLYSIDLSNSNSEITNNSRCLTARYSRGISNRKAESSGVLLIKESTNLGCKEAAPGYSIDLSFPGLNTRRGRVDKNIAHTLNTGSSQGVVTTTGRIRKLMPRECFRLQGFTDEQIDKLLAVSSDTQAYKQASNAVTANVVHALGLRLKSAHTASPAVTCAGVRDAS